jgi:hypothetical protein
MNVIIYSVFRIGLAQTNYCCWSSVSLAPVFQEAEAAFAWCREFEMELHISFHAYLMLMLNVV